ncbi:MAG: Ppx/GppA phosphatase family protein [Proteobacteria bacterium]|nr:Ppx/GppA phosphatase family protein [Pseudomonadota bacterium]
MYIRSSTEHVGAVAAIDIGSNSIHMVVARVDKSGNLEILDSDKVEVRLGAYLLPNGSMSREGQVRALRTLGHMAQIARAYKATVRAVATHAMREATNHSELIAEIAKKTGVQVEIIDGVEEARLVYLGMRYSLPLERQLCLGMDIGGGSTEFILANGDSIKFVTSLKIGAVTLSSNQFGYKSPTVSAIKKLHQYINLRIEPLVGEVSKFPFTKAVASSGTVKAIAAVHSRLFRGKSLTDENGYIVPVKDLEIIVKAMEELKSPKRIKEALGVESSRADIILAGAAIMREASRAFGVKEWVISTFGLREGVVIDSFRRMGGERLGKVKDIRWERVVELGRQLNIDEGYAGQVMRLSLEIFDKLAPILYPAGGKKVWMGDRDALSVSAWLHEIGKYLSSSSYHRHSYYLIHHCRLPGFTQDERQMIGLVTLHHRKSSPKFDAGELKGLRREEFDRVVFLSAILRMASALSRTRRGLVLGVRVGKARSLRFGFRIQKGADPSVELQQLEREREPLEKAFGWHFVIDPVKAAMTGHKPRATEKKPKKRTTKKKSATLVSKRIILKSTKKTGEKSKTGTIRIAKKKATKKK